MASPAANQANASNAAFSCGPRTAEGKEKSSQNARKHGFCSNRVVLVEGEKEIFERRHAALHAELQPANELESIFTDQIAICDWNMAKIGEMQAEYHAAHPDARSNLAGHRELELLRRYAVNAERGLFRALAELRTLQTTRVMRLGNPGPILVKKNAASQSTSMADIDAYFNATTPTSSAGRNEPNSETAEPETPSSAAPSGPQISRTRPCPCGSGQKFKRCCGRTSPGIRNS
jgi:hypothetical protein